ncbi:CHAD domain-containing protein [Methylobacterium sp. Leaf108]|uniref:CYTH and CHAD domain-containing protein n=1 Tax=Methylobacterium sp. Leaf108 TaxID=1736256 RepID=UPI0006FF12F6|nr:CHAD domain-containing protein [Methylobacterium sp. Leaf108]KQP50792.1 metal-chelation protein CHAD [Methylobacterium sp. Leaf108]
MSGPREIELKLEAGLHDMAALAEHPLLRTGEAQDTAVLSATYFDTADRDLAAAGLTLRVRRTPTGHVQTVKAAAAGAGLFDRPEWECPVEGPEPDLAALAATPAAAILADAKGAGLHAVFATVVERTTRPVRYGESRISVTLDQGRVETPDGDVPLCEVELELVEGRAADLFGLAQALAETVPLRLGALSKSERAFALLDGTLRRPSKARAVRLEETATAGDAFLAIAQACLRHLRRNEDVFLHGRDPEALHQMRVALRRLRSAFTLFKAMLAGDATAQHLRAEIKRVSEPFGQARNIDVFLNETLPAEIARRPDEASLTALRETLEGERLRAYDVVLSILEAAEWRGLVLDLAAWIETGPWRAQGASAAPARDVAAAILERARRRIKKGGRHLDRLDADARHRVRIEAKKLRYGAEFFGSLYAGKKTAKRHKAFVAALSDLQDHLGALNDLATAHGIVSGLLVTQADGEALFAAGLTAADGDAGAGALLEAAAEAHEALIDVTPFWR